MCNLNSSATCQVPVEVELLLKLKCLVASVGCPGPFPLRSDQTICYTQKCDIDIFRILMDYNTYKTLSGTEIIKFMSGNFLK